MPFSSRSLIVPLLLGVMVSACDKQSAPAGQDNAITSGEVTSPAPETGKAPAYSIDRKKVGEPLPDVAFTDEKGKAIALKEFSGKPVLVNLWATWCAPCIAEMPQLDNIAGAHSKDGLQLLTISQDSLGVDKVMAYWNGKGFKHIHPYLDPENKLGFHYGTGVLPTSVLYSADSKEIARIIGAPDWEGPEAAALIKEALTK